MSRTPGRRGRWGGRGGCPREVGGPRADSFRGSLSVGSQALRKRFAGSGGFGKRLRDHAMGHAMHSMYDSLAEWSNALASGASPQGRGLEPHSCHAPPLPSHAHASPCPPRGCPLFWGFWAIEGLGKEGGDGRAASHVPRQHMVWTWAELAAACLGSGNLGSVTVLGNAHRGARTHDRKVKGLVLCRLS